MSFCKGERGCSVQEFRLQDKIRIYALARELNVETKDLIDTCRQAGIDVKNQVAATLAVEDAANGFRGPAIRERMLLEERAERFQTGTIHIGQEATQTGAMRKTSASKQSHKGRFERSDALKEVRERPFPADGVAYQQGHKVNRFIAAEAASYEADPARAKASSSPLVAK